VFETIYSIGYIVGPSVAGVLASTIGPGPTLAIDALSFGISGIGLAFVRRDLRAPVDRPTQPLLADIREGIDYIAAHPTLRSAVLYWGATAIVTAPLVTAVTVYVTRELAYEPSVLGLVLTAYGVGTVAGAVASGRLIGRTRPAQMMLGGNLVMGLALGWITLAPQLPALLAAAVVAGSTQSVVLVTYLTLRTAQSPDALLGRIGSTARTISLGLQPVGLLVGGALVDATSASLTIAVMGIGVAGLSLAFLPVASFRRASLTTR
jgi:predicted MFS family arabinose efflux permease